MNPIDWLTIPQQNLLEITSGKIFHDDLGLKRVLKKFRYYPRDIWLYMMASQWSRISQEEAFVARASQVRDEIGSKIIAARITKDLMGLCFLMERKYAPYSKWFGTAFSELKIARKLKPMLTRILGEESIDERENWLSRAYEIMAEEHNSLGITEKSMPTKVSRYFNRPYFVIHADEFAKEIQKEIRDKRIRDLPLIGSVDQISDNSDFLENQRKLSQIRALYRS